MVDTSAIPRGGWYDKIQGDVYILLESPADTNRIRKTIIFFIATLIVLNVIVVILETVNALYIEYTTFFYLFDLFTVIVFTIEYVLRIWCCVKNPRYSDPVHGRIRYALSPFALVDVVALTPFYLPMFIPLEFRLLRLMRLLRIFRVLRLGKYSNAFDTFIDVLRSKKEEIVITLIMAMIILILASSSLYMAEREAQPKAFGSIPDAMWWAVVTLATVGYGDVYPITPLGKFFASLVAITAIGLFALPAGILASGFTESLARKRECNTDKTLACPRCGVEIDLRTGSVREAPKRSGSVETPKGEGEILEEIMR